MEAMDGMMTYELGGTRKAVCTNVVVAKFLFTLALAPCQLPNCNSSFIIIIHWRILGSNII